MSNCGPIAVVLDFQSKLVMCRGLTHCDRGGCPHRARWSTNLGFRCPGCARREERQAVKNRQLYGEGFLRADLLQAGFENNTEYGVLTARASSNPTCSALHYHPRPEQAVLELAGLPDVNRQAQAVARILWGLGLAIGADLSYWPRDAGYPPSEIGPYLDVIRWLAQSLFRVQWMLRYAGALMDAHACWRRSDGRTSSARHKSLDGAVRWWLSALQVPELRDRILVTPTDGLDWPPTARNHPAVLAVRNRRPSAA